MVFISNTIKFKGYEYDGDLISLYKDLYDGKKVQFDLLANGQIKFEVRGDGSICNRKDFKRALSS